MNFSSILLFSQFFLLHFIRFANGFQIMVEIEPDWKPLPEYRSLLEPEEHREVFQSKRFELQIYKEAIQEGISIAGTRVAKDRDLFMFKNIPEDWMEPTGVVLEIKLPPILSVQKIQQSEESFYQPRIRRPFRIQRNRNNVIYRFTILENPERNFRADIQLPMGETPTGGNEVAYMESLNNSLAKLEQSEQLCAQTKYECNLNLLLKYTHVERLFKAFLKATRETLTVSAQNYAKIRAKTVKLFTDIMKLAMEVLEEEKKIFKESASSLIDLYNSSPAVPIPTLHSPQHQHGQNSSQSSQTQTPTSGASFSGLSSNRKIIFKLMTIESIAHFLAGFHPARISQAIQTEGISGQYPSRVSQPSQLNIPAGTNQERMKFVMSDFLSPNSSNSGQFAHFQVGQQQQHQRETGQTSHGPTVGQAQEKGKEKVTNIVQPPTNVEEITSSEENDPNQMGQQMSSENIPIAENMERKIFWRHFVKFEDIWTSVHDPSDRAVHGDKRVAEEQQERFAFTDLFGIKRSQIYRWFFNKRKGLLKPKEKTRQEFESEKKKYQSEMAGNTSASKSEGINATFDDHQRAALWRHFVKYEDVLFTQSADVDKQKEEEEERSKLKNSIKLKPKQIKNWLYNTKSRLNTQEKTRQEYEKEKKKYQSEVAATGAGGDKASASASKVPSTAANEKTSNVEVISSSEETDPNPMAIVPAGPILNDPIDARPLNWMPPSYDKNGRKRKHSTENVHVARDEKRAKPNQGTSASAPTELPPPAVADLNLNLNMSNPEEEEDKMQEDD